MGKSHILRLHWKLFFPLVGLLWLIIAITITYSVIHETSRQKENLENRLLNVNNTVIAAYERGADLQETVDFIKLFTGQTTLDPLRITVYDNKGRMVADNPGPTIVLYDSNGNINPELEPLWNNNGSATVHDMALGQKKSMISLKTSLDGRIHSFAALPYKGEVLDFLRMDPMVWIAVIILGLLSSGLAYLGVRAICRNVYTLRDFAQAISSDKLPEEVDSWHFSKDELGDVSRNLLSLYRDKMHAEDEKTHHERQIGMNVTPELNTPVGIIKGYLDTVLNNEDMPEDVKHKFLLRAQQNADRLANLVNDVGMVMRLQENGQSIECKTLNFHDIVVQISEDIKLGHIADGMTFDFNIPEDCYIIAHESLLTNALLNLIYNASRHSGGNHISLCRLYEKDGRHVFSFADNGVGVDKEHLPRLFDLFYRVDAGRSRKNGGSGLGLPLVKRIIVALGGEISVENADTGGLKFIFSIPSGNIS